VTALRYPIAHFVVAVACGAATATAQSTSARVAAGDRAYAESNPAVALAQYKLAVAAKPSNVNALWKASQAAVALGEYPAGPDSVSIRETLYKQGEGYARRAIGVDSMNANAHFALAQALGRVGLTIKTPVARVPYSREVYREATKCLELEPASTPCAHVLGVWNAEVMRVPERDREMAISFLGARELSKASWDDAKRYLGQAVKAEPNVTLNHVDLARILSDMGDVAGAKVQLDAAIATPGTGMNETHYKAEARRMLSSLTIPRAVVGASR